MEDSRQSRLALSYTYFVAVILSYLWAIGGPFVLGDIFFNN